MTLSKQSEPKLAYNLKFNAIGTQWVIATSRKIDSNLAALVHNRIADFDKNYSRFRSDSLVTKMGAIGKYQLPLDARPLLDLHEQLYKLSSGSFTPLIGQTLSDAGYDANYRLHPRKSIASPPSWSDALNYDYPMLEVLQPSMLDVGAGGKGYLADIIGEILVLNNISEYVINAGGDIVQRNLNNDATIIALEDPEDTTSAIGTAKISNQSICGSSGNRRTWAEYTHIMNPKTLSSETDIAAVWVVAKTGLLADSLSTALYFIAPRQLNQHYNFEYATLHKDRSLTYSKNFPGEFFS